MRVKDDACASRVESYNWREPKKKRVHLNTHRVKKKKKKKKEIPKRRVTVTVGRSTGGAWSKRVVSEFHKLHRNRPELRCNRVKSFETRNKIAARCDVTLNRGRGGRWLNLRTESSIGVERIGDGVPNLCAVTFTRWNPCVSLETAAAWNFSLFFSIFFHLSSTSALLSRLSIVAPLLVEEEEARTYTSGRRETRHWASDFAADFTRKSFFDFGPQRTVIQTTTILFDSQPGRVI